MGWLKAGISIPLKRPGTGADLVDRIPRESAANGSLCAFGGSCMKKLLRLLILAVGVGILPVASQGQAQQAAPATASTQAPLTLTLQDALKRARANSVPYQAALTDQGVAHEDQVQARAALLPKVNYQNEFIYTQPAGGPTESANPGTTASGAQAPRFIANNSVHEYLSEGVAEESLGYAQYSDYRKI